MNVIGTEKLDPAALVAEISAALTALPSQRTDAVRALRRSYSRRLTAAPARAVVEVALQLTGGPSFQHRFVAYELVLYHRAALGSLGRRDLERFGRGLDSWWMVDTFACCLSGPAWREGQVPDKLIERWARSRDRWWRRAALVSTVPLNNRARGGRGDSARTLNMCGLLVGDRDDMVVKALSWSLRELVKHDAPAVRAFLKAHAVKLAPRVRREVENKLATGLKNPRNRSST